MSSEVGGEWWLPADTRRVPGVLKIGDDGGLTLTLIGALSAATSTGQPTESDPCVSPAGSPQVVSTTAGGLARVLGVADGIGYTLDRGIQTLHTRSLLGGRSSQTIKFDVGYRGVYFRVDEPALFDRVSVEMS